MSCAISVRIISTIQRPKIFVKLNWNDVPMQKMKSLDMNFTSLIFQTRKAKARKIWPFGKKLGIDEIVLISLVLCQGQNLYRLSLAFMIDRRIVEIISLIFKSSSTIHHSSPIMQFHSACYCCCNVQFMLQANIF